MTALPGARLEHRMAAVDDVEHAAVVHEGPDVAALVGDLGQRGEDVERRQRPGGGRRSSARAATPRADLVEQLVLEPARCRSSAPSTLRLVLLQLGRHVALGADQRLAPHVVGGSARGLRVGDLDPVAEHAVEAHAEARSPSAPLALLEAGDPARAPRRASRTELAERRVPRSRE